MGALLFYITAGFLLLRLGVAVYNLLSDPYLHWDDAAWKGRPLVSVLIPARNEQDNIQTILADVQAQQWPFMEILVLDDASDDDTWDRASTIAQGDERIKLIRGEALPQGWLGKNWACHQLAQQATGKYFLFLDADVRLQPQALPAAIREMQQRELALLSLFPDQALLSWGEKIVVPVMHYLLLSLLPLRLILKSKNPAFAAANGQFMCFLAGSYRQHRWHEQVKDKITEDIAIQRLHKEKGLLTETLLGNGLVRCRMYTSYDQAVQGFSKNFMAFFGWNVVWMALYLFLSILVYFWLAFTLAWWQLALLLVGVIILKILISIMGKQRVGEQLLLQPLQMLQMLQLAWLSFYRRHTRTNIWKGRKLK